jgi:hypothetical protein
MVFCWSFWGIGCQNGISSSDVSSEIPLDHQKMSQTVCQGDPELENQEVPRAFLLARHYAPVIYQDTDWKYRADFITNFDFDGNFSADDNWENIDRYPLKGYVYYSLIETETHYFLAYFFYHPQHYALFFDNELESYENDMDGLLLVITKGGSSWYGQILLMETWARDRFWQYTNSRLVQWGNEDIDGGIWYEYDDHPRIVIAPRKHGAESLALTSRNLSEIFTDASGLIYWYTGMATEPRGPGDMHVGYELIPLRDSLWRFRHEIGNGRTYDHPFVLKNGCSLGANFDGDNYLQDWGTPPWAWDEVDDGKVGKGEWFFWPAQTIQQHFRIKGRFSTYYLYHPYLGIFDQNREIPDSTEALPSNPQEP